MDYKMRFATLDDHDFSHIEQFHVIEVDGSFAGFVQYDFVYPYFDVIEIHLFPEDRGKGIGSDILRYLQKVCIARTERFALAVSKRITRRKRSIKSLIMQAGTAFCPFDPGFMV